VIMSEAANAGVRVEPAGVQVIVPGAEVNVTAASRYGLLAHHDGR
jgi:hypothetical protein